MTENSFQTYLDEHRTQQITIGRSGANVYELDHQYIAKQIRRDLLQSDSEWEAYQREQQFYASYPSERFPFLPKIFHCRQTEDEIQLVMEKYHPISREHLDDAMLEKVFAVLVQIHHMPLPEFLSQSEEGPLRLAKEEIDQCLDGWRDVVREHGNVFAERDLGKIGERINAINQQAYTSKKRCCHGDFHFDNLLTDDKGNIIVCDWQNVNCGHVSGDLSFFLSRLSADGIEISKEKAIRMYCRLAMDDTTCDEIAIQMSLANLNVSFLHWHHYLRGCSVERVRGIWDNMMADAELLYAVCAR